MKYSAAACFRWPWTVLASIFVAAFLFGCGGGGGGGDGTANTEEQVSAAISAPTESSITIYEGSGLALSGSAKGGRGSYTYLWDFDGAHDNIPAQNPGEIMFGKTGTYSITLSATDGQGAKGSDSFTLIVLTKSSLTLVSDDFAKFVDNPTDENYDKVIVDIDQVDDSGGASLYKALAVLLDIYRSDLFSSLKDDFGIGDLSFDNSQTFFDNLNLNSLTCTFLKKQIVSSGEDLYRFDLDETVEETITRLDQVDWFLARAQGINLMVPLSALQAVYFDDTDINMLRCMVSLMKAALVYYQAVDYRITDYRVNYNGHSYDIRDLVTDPVDPLAPLRSPVDNLDEEYMDGAIQDLIAKNPTLLTYKNRSKLSSFRSALQDAVQYYTSAMDALENLAVQQAEARSNNAFSLDTDYSMAMARMERDQLLPSLMSCFNSADATFTAPRAVATSQDVIDGGDGYYYPRKFYNIFLDTYSHDTYGVRTTIFDLLSTAAGAAKSPRDLLLKMWDFENQYPALDFEPYVQTLGSTPATQPLAEIDWDNPIDPYTIPQAAISIDGNGADWAAVPVLSEEGGVTCKIARDGSDYYLFLQSDFNNSTSGSWSWSSQLEVDMTCGDYPFSGQHYYCSVSIEMLSSNASLNFYGDQNGTTMGAGDYSVLPGNSGVEAKVASGLPLLVKKSSTNQFSAYSQRTGQTSTFTRSTVKFLPEAE
jgi:hypothetical protein